MRPDLPVVVFGKEPQCQLPWQRPQSTGEMDMGDKGSKDKGKREQQKKAKLTQKEKRKLKRDKKKK